MDDWYCRISGEPSGPFSREELQFLKDRGKLAPTDDVRSGHRGEWQAAQSVPGLFPSHSVRVDQRLPKLVPISEEEGHDTFESGTAASEDTTSVTTDSAVQNSQMMPPVRQSSSEDSRWRKAAIGSAIGAGVVLLILLLLLLFLPVQFDGFGASAGTGSGDADGNGTGFSDSSDSSEVPASGSGADSGEIVEEDVTQNAEATADARENDSDHGPSAEDENGTQRRRPQIPKFTLGELNAPPETTSGQTGAASSGDLGELNKRLEREGAGSGEVQISLIWYNINDLDLHILCPSGERICFQNTHSACGGELDVDMNAGGQISNQPVENAFWPTGAAPQGKYQIYVHHYANNGSPDPSQFEVVVKNGGQSKKFTGSLNHGDPMKKIYEFTR